MRMSIATNVGLNVDNNFKITPLMEATKQNDYVAAKVLIKSGAKVNAKNIAGVTALHIASSNNSFETAKVLLDDGDATVNIEDDEGFTPLMRACLNKNDSIVELLLSNGAEIWNENIYRENALMHSTMVDCYKCIELLAKYNNLQDSSESSLKYMEQNVEEALKIAYKKDDKKLEELLNGFLNKNVKSDNKNKKKNKDVLDDDNKLLLQKLQNKNNKNNEKLINILDDNNTDNNKITSVLDNQKLGDVKAEQKPLIKYGKEYIFLWQKKPISYYENLKKTNNNRIKQDTVISKQPKTISAENKNINK